MKKFSDNPLYCSNREGAKCKIPQEKFFCPKYKRRTPCCIVCPEVKTCYFACPKVLSFLAYVNPAKLPKKELDELIRLREEEARRVIGNPSSRRKNTDESF